MRFLIGVTSVCFVFSACMPIHAGSRQLSSHQRVASISGDIVDHGGSLRIAPKNTGQAAGSASTGAVSSPSSASSGDESANENPTFKGYEEIKKNLPPQMQNFSPEEVDAAYQKMLKDPSYRPGEMQAEPKR